MMRSRKIKYCDEPARVLVLIALMFTGCTTHGALTLSDELPFDRAVQLATDGLVAQTRTLPTFLTQIEVKLGKRVLVIDPLIDAKSGQQTSLTKLLEKTLTEHLTTMHEQFEVLPFHATNLAKAEYLLTGTTSSITSGRSMPAWRISLALTDLKSRNVVAQASVVARDDGFDTNPTLFYRDSPVLMKDAITDGYVRTSVTIPGQPADKIYFDRLSAATKIDEATLLYNRERYEEALREFKVALANPSGEQMRVHGGVYLTSAKLGIKPDAEGAFLKLVTMAIAAETLNVKFLFKPGTTDFWPDPQISGPYPMWLRQIAIGAASANTCMDVIGHTSHTGSAEFNDKLSLQRAVYIKQRLEAETGELAGRIKASGKGFRENIVGTGTDDARDALDRRVEFKIERCG
jgi:hypothetical protein